jgi:hypothetical protein
MKPGPENHPLNLRFCVRAWSVLSIAWIAYCLWHSMLVCPLNRIGIQIPNGLWCRFSEVDQLSYYSNLVLKMFGIPALVLVALAAADWAWRGFRSSPLAECVSYGAQPALEPKNPS